MPLQATSGAASYDAFGGGAPAVPNYIEDVFSTYLYTGTGASQTQTNNIDLSGKGGLVWLKRRSGVEAHYLQDSSSSFANSLSTNSTAAAITSSGVITSVSSTGFTTSSISSGITMASWTFRKQPKFFDVVTYTGNGSTQNIAHSLGSAPGCVIIKCVSSSGNWPTYHRGTTAGNYLYLNGTSAQSSTSAATFFGNNTTTVAPTSTQFTVGSSTQLNTNGETFVAYLFAHDAGGFGLTGTDNVISCGSYTGNGSTTGPIINLGYEPQWVLIKDASNGSPDWWMFDNIRGVATGSLDMGLLPNTTGAEVTGNDYLSFNATGFQPTTTTNTLNTSGDTYIYIAIRRGPMKVPTSGTSVLGLNARTGTGAATTVSGGIVSDFAIVKNRGAAVSPSPTWASRLTGNYYMGSSSSAAQAQSSLVFPTNAWDVMDGVKVGNSAFVNASSNTYINYLFKRAPSFADVVCYTGTGVARNLSHGLQSTPELIIVKARSVSNAWTVYSSATGASNYLSINSTAASASSSTMWNATAPTSSVFTVGTDSDTNYSTGTFIAYLFASCPGVSKVGSYTGTGTTLQIDCGFAAGARFVLIKRTSSTGDWYVWDSARGIIAGNDPYLLLNSDAVQVTNTDYVDTYSAGFEISSTAPAAINASGGTFIFLAIA
jgi:hypothetical protein